MTGATSNVNQRLDSRQRRIWEIVSQSPAESLWNLQGVPVRTVALRIWKAVYADRLPGHAAELGFYFLFAVFPTLFCASSILGLVARSAYQVYDKLLDHLALVIPNSALGAVLNTFNETTVAASSGKVTFGLVAAVWSGSIGISAIQDTLNIVYKIEDSRSYFIARLHAIGLTIVLTIIISLGLACLLGGDYLAALAKLDLYDPHLAMAATIAARVLGLIMAAALLNLSFAVIYYWAPDLKKRRWRWLTPGGALGLLGWFLASLGLRLYLHYFDNYSLIYGSLGAVIILLTWFYITGLMLLLGAAINSEIEAAAAEMRLALQAPPQSNGPSGPEA